MTEAKIDLSTVRFGRGEHPPVTPTGDRDMCIMEAVAFVAGEPWSDAPACASPIIAAFLRNWNDSLSNEDRDRLLPAAVWVPRLVGSLGNEEVELRRSYLALDWLLRIYTPAWLDLVPSLATHAAKLRDLPEMVDRTMEADASLFARSAETAARSAARSALRDDVRDAAWDAAGDAAGDAARAAAAGDAARDAARDATGAAARAAAWAATPLQPTVERLQASALDLLDRMLAVKA